MNKNVDALAVSLLLLGFACVSSVERLRVECPWTAVTETALRHVRAVGIEVPLPKLCLTWP